MQKHNKAKPTKLMACMLSGAMALFICMTAVYATPAEKYQENVKKRDELQVHMGQNQRSSTASTQKSLFLTKNMKNSVLRWLRRKPKSMNLTSSLRF